MLNKNFRYVAMDFETTGLDPKKDEAIQIGLVEIDINGKVVNEFKSFLKPQKDIKELRDLVAYITGISLKDLESAPSIFDIKENVLKFFGDDVILIGQNIQFDIDFIQKYFGDIKYFDTIDTFVMAQNLIHFAPSYALDVLVEYLMSRKEFISCFLQIHQGKKFDVQQSHDALYDSKNALVLFFYILGDMIYLIKKYPILLNFLEKNTGLYHKIINSQSDRSGKKNGKLELPNLEKQLPKDVSLNTRLKIDLNNYDIKKRYYIGNVDMNDFFQGIIGSNKDIIFSFSSIAKLNIVKNMLNELGVKNVGFARGQMMINKNKFNIFLNKNTFGDNELMFIFKYMSHVRYNMSILDLNTKFDYKINYYIQDDNKDKRYPIVLTTHGGLFSILDGVDHIYKNYDICFFDTEMWYKGYNEYLSSSCDLYAVLTFLDNLYYKYILDNQEYGKNALDIFARFFEIFMGVLFKETKKQFVNIQNNYIMINPILDNLDFFETNALIKKFAEHKRILEETLDQKDFEKLWLKITHMFKIFSGLVQVNKQMYGQSDFYFLYNESTQFTNRDEFTDIFLSKVWFFSNYDKSYNKILENSICNYKINFKKIGIIDYVVDYLQSVITGNEEKICFIMSTVKIESKELFEKIYAKGLNNKADLLVENITGSLGKNIFKAKTSGSKIIIGGYNFMLWLLSNKINIDICIDFNIKGKMSNYLLTDLKRYAQNSK